MERVAFSERGMMTTVFREVTVLPRDTTIIRINLEGLYVYKERSELLVYHLLQHHTLCQKQPVTNLVQVMLVNGRT